MRHMFRRLAVPALLGALAITGTACEQFGGDDDDDRRRDRSRDRISRSDPDDRRDDGDRRRGMDQIPSDARRLERGTGEYNHTFQDDGTLYVYDRTDDRVVYRATIRRDDRFTFDPEDDEMRINNDRVGGDDLNLRARHTYEFYFDER